MLFELKLALRGADHFTARLLMLMLKADASNMNRLSTGFPDEVQIISEWRAGLIDEKEIN
jgi:hypothetical protein